MFSYITQFFYPHKTLLQTLMPGCVIWVDEFFRTPETTPTVQPQEKPADKIDQPPPQLVEPASKQFTQALQVFLNARPFVKNDFLNINAQNKLGMTVLHMAVLTADKEGIKLLLQCGADVAVTDQLGRTPLKLAYLVLDVETFRALLQPRLKAHPEIIKLTEFTYYQAKQDGITSGGFFKDKNKEGWLLKEGHYDFPLSVLNEYVAGGVFQLLLGENAPHTEIILNNLQGTFLIGSKLFSNFRTINDYIIYEPLTLEGFRVDANHTIYFNGKPVVGFFDVLCAIYFLSDTDGHFGNVGVIDQGDYFSFAKIDHGFSFNFDNEYYFNHGSDNHHVTLDTFRYELHEYYHLELESLGYDQVFQPIAKIGYANFTEIEKEVSDRVKKSEPYFEVLELNDLDLPYDKIHKNYLQVELNEYQISLLLNLQYKQQDFQKMAEGMALEKAIREHDLPTFSTLLSQGVNLDEPFKPFFCEETVCPLINPSVTGRELIKAQWPELMVEMPLHVEDILSPNNPLDVLGENHPLHFIENHPSLYIMPQIPELPLPNLFEIV